MSDKIEELKNNVGEVVQEGRDALEQAADSAEDAMNDNVPSRFQGMIPYLAGAVGVGIVIGLLLPREKPSTRALDNRLEELRDLLGTIKKRVSLTAGDSYDDVSAALGGAMKKAKKRFNLS